MSFCQGALPLNELRKRVNDLAAAVAERVPRKTS